MWVSLFYGEKVWKMRSTVAAWGAVHVWVTEAILNKEKSLLISLSPSPSSNKISTIPDCIDIIELGYKYIDKDI